MAKYLIERNVPGAHELLPEQLNVLMQKSYSVLLELSPDVLWVQSYITEDKFTCIYIAPNTELLFEHARRSGFPVDRISEIKSIIDPTFSEALMAAEVIHKVEVDHGKASMPQRT